MPATSGYQARWVVKGGASPRDMSAGSERWPFISDSGRRTKELLLGEGITGSRSHHISQTRAGAYKVGGALVCNPSYAFFDAWLPRILGGVESTDTFPVAETLPEWDIMNDRVAKIVRYNDCKVGKFTLRYAPGLLQGTIDYVGKTAVETGNTFPTVALGVAAADTQLTYHESTFSLAALTTGQSIVREGIITVDNMPDELPAAGMDHTETVREGGRVVTLTLTNGMTVTEWDQLYGTETPWTATVTNAYGLMSNVWTLRNLQAPRETPIINGKGEVTLGLTFTAHEDNTNKELTVVNDPVP